MPRRYSLEECRELVQRYAEKEFRMMPGRVEGDTKHGDFHPVPVGKMRESREKKLGRHDQPSQSEAEEGRKAEAARKQAEQKPPEKPAPRTHDVDKKHGLRFSVRVGDKISIQSRGKKPWVALLGGKDKKYGREREFLSGREERGGMRGQIVTYTFKITEPGEYELAGDEFGPFRHSFEVEE